MLICFHFQRALREHRPINLPRSDYVGRGGRVVANGVWDEDQTGFPVGFDHSFAEGFPEGFVEGFHRPSKDLSRRGAADREQTRYGTGLIRREKPEPEGLSGGWKGRESLEPGIP